MKTLLRSTIIADPTDNPDTHLENFRHLDASGLEFQEAEDVAIWSFVRSFYQQHHHAPDVSTIQSHFERTNEVSVADRVNTLRSVKPRNRGDFRIHLDVKAEDRRKVMIGKLLQEAGEIVTRGITIQGPKGEKTILQGPIDAVKYFMDGSHAIVMPSTGAKLSGDVVHDGADFLVQYDRVKNDPLAGVGQFTGIRQIDDAFGGAKKFELWTHAAFTGHMKSTVMMNWAYTQAVYYNHSSLIFSLEMPYGQCRNILYAMHSCHEKFEKIHPPLEYQQIKEGTLDAKAEWFLREHVVPDFNQNPDYGSILIEVSDPEKPEFTVADARARAETLYAKTPFNLLFIDHALLMAPRHHVPNTTDRLNEVIRDCKKMAMGFNKGMGMAVVLLFQISREGYKSALKARGLDREPGREPKNGQAKPARAPSMYVYNLSHLSYSNECLVGNTPVITSKGVIPIQKIKVGDEVWSSTGWKPVLDTFDQGAKPTWLIETDRGSQLEVTEKHRVRTLCSDGTLAWSEAQTLTAGDWVVGAPPVSEWPASPSLPKHPISGSEVVLSDAISYILGVWHGDGVEREASIEFTGNRKELDLRNRIVNTFLEAFGVPLDVHEYPSRPGSFDLTCYGNKSLRNWFCSFAGEEHGQRVPDCILQGSRSNVIAFLKGLFDADGYVNSQHVTGLKMKSQAFLLQVQSLLARLGCDSDLRSTKTTLKKTGKTYIGWNLRLLGYESRLWFTREIGFTEAWKMNRLLVSVVNAPKRKTTDQVYPVGPLFVDLCKQWTPHSLIRTKVLRKSHQNNIRKAIVTGLVARGAIQYLLTYLDSIGVVDERVEALRHILTMQVMQVRSCEPTDRTEQVYDIEVGGDHEYATGPLLSHNCERSSDIVTATWLDEELSKKGQILIQCLKSRDQKPFEPFMSSIFWPCRRIKTLEDPNIIDLSDIADSVDLDDIV